MSDAPVIYVQGVSKACRLWDNRRREKVKMDFYGQRPTMSPMKVTLDIADETFASLRRSPDEFGAELRLAAAVKWFELGRISQAKAAEVADLSRAEFIAALQGFGVSPVQLRPGELAAELRS